MKKTMRTLICLLLVIVAVVNFAAPAMATVPGNTKKAGNLEDKNGVVYQYECKLTATTSKITAELSYGGISQLSCTATATVYHSGSGVTDKTYGYGIGSGKATATANNIIEISSGNVNGTVIKATGTYVIQNGFSYKLYL